MGKSKPPNEDKRKSHGQAAAGVHAIAFLLLFIAYLTRWESIYALVTWPAWIWAVAGIMLTVLPVPRIRFMRRLGFALAWVLFAMIFDDQPRALMRQLVPVPEMPSAIRIVSLNCAGGEPSAAEEALKTGADIVLLQETPARPRLEPIARQYGYPPDSIVCGLDTAILVKGDVVRANLPAKRFDYVSAMVALEKGPRAHVVCLRLSPPIFRLDLWNPGYWMAYADDVSRRRAQLEEIMSTVTAGDELRIVGGDFNSGPARNLTGGAMQGYADAFAVAGRGWGATGTNDYPIVRFDQIWLKGPAKFRSASSWKTAHSDHRMAYAELGLVDAGMGR